MKLVCVAKDVYAVYVRADISDGPFVYLGTFTLTDLAFINGQPEPTGADGAG